MISVDIHILNTDTLEGEVERILPLIAPCYAAKYERMKVHSGKMQELGAGYLLYKVLGVSKDDQLVLGEKGKPALSMSYKGNCGNAENAKTSGCTDEGTTSLSEFSLSHADNYVVLVVSTEPVGVDIERCDRLTLPVLKRVLPRNYYENLTKPQNIDESEDKSESVPFQIKQEWAKAWTSIEAVLKADGSGFSVDPREDATFMEGWSIESFPYENDFMISCACRKSIFFRKFF